MIRYTDVEISVTKEAVFIPMDSLETREHQVSEAVVGAQVTFRRPEPSWWLPLRQGKQVWDWLV